METRVHVYASLPYPDTLHPTLAKILGPDGVSRGVRSRMGDSIVTAPIAA
jgi:hypothetical protein